MPRSFAENLMPRIGRQWSEKKVRSYPEAGSEISQYTWSWTFQLFLNSFFFVQAVKNMIIFSKKYGAQGQNRCIEKRRFFFV